MKLFRWTLAGASFYVIYKYSIGKKAQGKDVFVSPDGSQPEAPDSAALPAGSGAATPSRSKKAPTRRRTK